MSGDFRGQITLDGPSGTGKSSVARDVARKLGAAYLDTGAMYRAATVAVLDAGVSLDDKIAVARAVSEAEIRVGTNARREVVTVDGVDVRERIRGAEVTRAVSPVSAVPAVRKLLVARQRELVAAADSVVVEGRDIGTVVLPDATLKIYLTAAPEVRALRRADAAGRDRHGQDRRAGAGPAPSRRVRQPARGQSAAAGRGRDRGRQHRARQGRRRRAHPRTGRRRRAGGRAVMTESNGPLPVVAIVGRPNVGKSTLVNRFLGRRAAVVQDIPGVTRDRISYEALWNGKKFTVVDTGGWDPKATGMGASITRQAKYAMDTADVIVLVVDSTVGATDTDLAAARILRRSDRPVILVANKVDDERSEAGASELWSLGLGEPQPVSALHGRSSGDLLDLILDAMPEAPREQLEEGGPRRVALVGRPNVGKSSLLNRVAKDERSVVDSVAGTTVDPVDSLVMLGGEEWRFVDTAGLRRKVNTASGTEYYASLRTEAAIQAAEVAVVLLAADEVISEQDQRVITQVVEAGRALVIAFNKWDTLDEDRHMQLEKEIERELARIKWATRVNISASTGRGVNKLADHLRAALASWESRVPTSELNSFVRALVQETPPPARGGRAPKIKYVTQADIRPPRFVVFSTGFLEAGYRRFLERKIRERWGFEGTPIEVSVKVREGRGSEKPKG